MKKFFFGPNFHFDTLWKGKYKLRIGSVLPSNRHQLSNSLKDMSAESIRNRFLGSKKEFSEAELTYLTELDGYNHYAIGVEETERPYRGVGIVRLVRSAENPDQAEIAVTIIDEYQGIGLGILLMRLIVLAATERDLHTLSFTFLPQNEAIKCLIQKLGPLRTGGGQMDYVQWYLDLSNVEIEKIKSELRPYIPQI